MNAAAEITLMRSAQGSSPPTILNYALRMHRRMHSAVFLARSLGPTWSRWSGGGPDSGIVLVGVMRTNEQ
jgi:hypothetical protein